MRQDFFAVLKQIVEGNARNNPTAPQSLSELLLRDVLTRGIDADQINFQNVLNNTRAYVEVVYHESFSSDLMQFTGQQLIQFSRRAIEWNPENMNPDSILITCAVVVHHNKALGRDILSSIDTILRALLSRLNVGTEGLSRLLQATSSLHKKTSNDTGVTNVVLHSLLEILSDGLRLKARVLPSTLKSMIEVVMTTDTPGGFSQIISRPSFLGLVEPAIHFIQNHPWQDGEKDFAASLAAARLVLQASTQDPNIMNRLSEYGTEARLATSTETALIDLNYAYIAIKLWILLAFKVTESSCVAKDFQTWAVWNELWPPFEGLIDQFELDPGGALYLTAGTLVLSSVAELFIFLRTLHTQIALDVSVHITTLNRLRQLGPGDTLNQKLTRALQYMLEPPPEMQFEMLVNQAAKDVVAAEKLRTLDTRILQDRKTLERHRREIRAIT
ncbi:hypothetical protein C0993_009992 [Termitomyces sp. T159_Od127]|nr:hypothetical protein C0993_009992 [Termitomyces sp. T159_Od127]